jgi:hypothetical protein
LLGSKSVGFLYIDFDADLNPPEQSDGALDWTGVAHMLDIPGAVSQLADLGPRRPLLSLQDVMICNAMALIGSESRDASVAATSTACANRSRAASARLASPVKCSAMLIQASSNALPMVSSVSGLYVHPDRILAALIPSPCR